MESIAVKVGDGRCRRRVPTEVADGVNSSESRRRRVLTEGADETGVYLLPLKPTVWAPRISWRGSTPPVTALKTVKAMLIRSILGAKD